MLYFKNWNDEIVSGAGLEATCPVNPITIEAAYDDWVGRPPKQRLGLTHCYCLRYYNNNGTIEMTIPRFKDLQQVWEDDKTPCE
jgi:hypothetical protein